MCFVGIIVKYIVYVYYFVLVFVIVLFVYVSLWKRDFVFLFYVLCWECWECFEELLFCYLYVLDFCYDVKFFKVKDNKFIKICLIIMSNVS